jgi:uncharacterized protein with HEPN domain
MTEKSEKFLSDILMSIELIEEFISGFDFNSYDIDRKTQSAVERQLAIIGEALNQFRKREPNISIENDKQIVAFRNRLIHAYDSLDNSIVWVIINRYTNLLKTEIEILLRK